MKTTNHKLYVAFIIIFASFSFQSSMFLQICKFIALFGASIALFYNEKEQTKFSTLFATSSVLFGLYTIFLNTPQLTVVIAFIIASAVGLLTKKHKRQSTSKIKVKPVVKKEAAVVKNVTPVAPKTESKNSSTNNTKKKQPRKKATTKKKTTSKTTTQTGSKKTTSKKTTAKKVTKKKSTKKAPAKKKVTTKKKTTTKKISSKATTKKVASKKSATKKAGSKKKTTRSKK